MTLEYSPFNLTDEISFNVPYKNLFYSVTVNFFPFRKNKKELLKTDIHEIYTPIAHFEFKVLDIEESIYRSQYMMPAQALYAMERLDIPNINTIAALIVEEVGFEKRIAAYLKDKEAENQLSLF